MKRRDVLATTAVLVSTGCLGSDTGNNGGSTDNGGDGSGTETTTQTTGIETRAGGTVEPTTDAGTETKTTVKTVQPTTETTETTNGTPNPIPIPDAPTDNPKDTPLTGEAQVTFENDGSRIVVTGVITGKNGCQTAVLDSVRRTNSGLVITVATERDASTDAVCSMALVEIEYRFVVRVERPPKSVTVVHRGMAGRRTITTVKRG